MYAIHIPTAPGPRALQALLIVQIPNAQEIIIVLGKLPDAARQGLQFRKNVNHVIVTDADADADADAHVENRIQNVRPL
ncbi:hypothetical protein N7519_003638 [Penicillium mononematosum]|uniref:uncharacterized protein n=1 Tax=Penicillium mononematosum TaxID=268346 RepID=UPI002547C391|nr:uncharacterized protein N7519_003638 [Penicillium mononematosum]KAJ6188730.1 hypothetical protein N7519_003638 [Penicillium mononematosum]